MKIKNIKLFISQISLDNWLQTGMTFFSILSGILLAYKIKWGYICGLTSQPFWHLFAIRKKYWGVEILNVFYGAIHIIGFYNWFFIFK